MSEQPFPPLPSITPLADERDRQPSTQPLRPELQELVNEAAESAVQTFVKDATQKAAGFHHDPKLDAMFEEVRVRRLNFNGNPASLPYAQRLAVEAARERRERRRLKRMSQKG